MNTHFINKKQTIFIYYLKIDVNQLNRILEVVGYPSENLLAQINEEARTYLERAPRKPTRVNFAEHFSEIRSPLGMILDFNKKIII